MGAIAVFAIISELVPREFKIAASLFNQTKATD